MKVYTKNGDKGHSRTMAGSDLPKSDVVFRANGDVDELNSHIGLARAACVQDMLDQAMETIQRDLFVAGCNIAAAEVGADTYNLDTVQASWTERLEQQIDTMWQDTGELKCFVLPGGGELGSRLHVARTVCRRAERTVSELADKYTLDEQIGQYLNRLADWLFAAARFANHCDGFGDTPWHRQNDAQAPTQ